MGLWQDSRRREPVAASRPEHFLLALSKIELVKSQTWCEEVAIISMVLRPEGPLHPAQAVRPGGQQWTRKDLWDRPRLHRPFRAECLVNCDPGLTASLFYTSG